MAQLDQIEGTLIMHFSHAITQDQELGMDFIKYARANKREALQPFNISLLLAISHIRRFEDAVRYVTLRQVNVSQFF